MRKALPQRDRERTTVFGTCERMGSKRGGMGDELPVLLRDIRTPDGEPSGDHRWLNLTKPFAELGLPPGAGVQFDARVKEYETGYTGRREAGYVPIARADKRSPPTKVRKGER